MPAPEDARILRLLEALIVMRKFRLRDLEQRLGMSAGTLRRILKGRIELKFRHITDLLAILDIPHKTFFKIAYEGDEDGTAESLLARVQRIGLPTPEPRPVTLDRQELEALIVATVERLGIPVPQAGSTVPPTDSPAKTRAGGTSADRKTSRTKKDKPAQPDNED